MKRTQREKKERKSEKKGEEKLTVRRRKVERIDKKDRRRRTDEFAARFGREFGLGGEGRRTAVVRAKECKEERMKKSENASFFFFFFFCSAFGQQKNRHKARHRASPLDEDKTRQEHQQTLFQDGMDGWMDVWCLLRGWDERRKRSHEG